MSHLVSYRCAEYVSGATQANENTAVVCMYPLQNYIHSRGKLVGFRHSVHFHLRYRSVSYLSIRVVVICAVNFQLYPLRRCKLRNLSWVYSAVSHSLKAFTGRRKLLKVAPNVFLSMLLIQILSFKARKLKLCMQPLLN